VDIRSLFRKRRAAEMDFDASEILGKRKLN